MIFNTQETIIQQKLACLPDSMMSKKDKLYVLLRQVYVRLQEQLTGTASEQARVEPVPLRHTSVSQTASPATPSCRTAIGQMLQTVQVHLSESFKSYIQVETSELLVRTISGMKISVFWCVLTQGVKISKLFFLASSKVSNPIWELRTIMA